MEGCKRAKHKIEGRAGWAAFIISSLPDAAQQPRRTYMLLGSKCWDVVQCFESTTSHATVPLLPLHRRPQQPHIKEVGWQGILSFKLFRPFLLSTFPEALAQSMLVWLWKQRYVGVQKAKTPADATANYVPGRSNTFPPTKTARDWDVAVLKLFFRFRCAVLVYPAVELDF